MAFTDFVDERKDLPKKIRSTNIILVGSAQLN